MYYAMLAMRLLHAHMYALNVICAERMYFLMISPNLNLASRVKCGHFNLKYVKCGARISLHFNLHFTWGAYIST